MLFHRIHVGHPLLAQGCKWILLSAMIGIYCAVLALTCSGAAQMPVAELPRVYINSTYQQPSGGKTWVAHNAADLINALRNSAPGDVINLDAGVTYVGHFVLPIKPNPSNLWIYVQSAALASLPEGTRVSPSVANFMPKIVTPDTSSPITLQEGNYKASNQAGAGYYRLAGLEVYSATTQGGSTTTRPPSNNWTYQLIDTPWDCGGCGRSVLRNDWRPADG